MVKQTEDNLVKAYKLLEDKYKMLNNSMTGICERYSARLKEEKEQYENKKNILLHNLAQVLIMTDNCIPGNKHYEILRSYDRDPLEVITGIKKDDRLDFAKVAFSELQKDKAHLQAIFEEKEREYKNLISKYQISEYGHGIINNLYEEECKANEKLKDAVFFGSIVASMIFASLLLIVWKWF